MTPPPSFFFLSLFIALWYLLLPGILSYSHFLKQTTGFWRFFLQRVKECSWEGMHGFYFGVRYNQVGSCYPMGFVEWMCLVYGKLSEVGHEPMFGE
jgi:hypothetical protein